MGVFQTACGATAPLTLDIEGPGRDGVERRRFAQPCVVVGRDDRADLVLDDDRVGRRHAYLQVIGGRVHFADLDGRLETAPGAGPADSGWLSVGEALVLGPYTVRLAEPAAEGVDDGRVPNSPLQTPRRGSDDLPPVTLEFQCRAAGHSVWRMRQVLALAGSAPRCKVRLFDREVSRVHCALLRTPQGLWVVDLLGRGGIAVNGEAVKAARLGAGDVLGMGQVVIRPAVEGRPGSGSSAEGLPPWAEPSAAPLPASLATVPPAAPPGSFATDCLPPAADLAANAPALALLLNHFARMQQQQMDQFQQTVLMMLRAFHGAHREQLSVLHAELDRLRDLNAEVAAIKAQLTARPSYPPPPTPGPRPARPVNGSPARRAKPNPGPSRGAAPDPPEPIPALRSPGPEVHDWLNERLAALTAEQQTRWQRVLSAIRGGPGG